MVVKETHWFLWGDNYPHWEAEGNNLSIWEKVILRAASLKSFEEIFSEDQFIIYLEKRVYLTSPAKEPEKEQSEVEKESAEEVIEEEPTKEGSSAIIAKSVGAHEEQTDIPAQKGAEEMEIEKWIALEEQTMTEVEFEKLFVQQPHWADSPRAKEIVPQEIEDIDLIKSSPSEQEEAQPSSSVPSSEIELPRNEVANLKKACISAFQMIPTFVTSTLKENVYHAFREKTNIDLYFSGLRHKDIKAEVLAKIIECENEQANRVNEYVSGADQIMRDST